MFDSNQKLRHLPFFEEVALHEEGVKDWHSATAGLVVLRLVDTWLESGLPAGVDDDWGIRSVRCTIDAVNEGTPIRAILGRVVDALQEQRPDIHVVISPLMAYAQALEYDAKWLLAVDVYHSVLAHLHPVEDADASVAAHMRLGYCYRNLNSLDAATEAFASASEIARENGDMVNVLLARVNEGHIAIVRGNLPRAESILDETIARANGEEFLDVRSRALHARSNVAHARGNYDFAIQLAYTAFTQSQTATQRDRILSDMAGAFFELGVFTGARDAYLVLSATAQEQYMRWAATINLLEISSQTGVETMFETYRRQLLNEPMPPYLATGFELNVGLGYRRLGDFAKARTYLERAMMLAAEHGLNQFQFEAEEALLQLETESPPHRLPTNVSLNVAEVARAIQDLRESVGIS